MSIYKKIENKFAKSVKGRRQPASGAFTGLKGDIKTKNLLFELKYTDKKSYTLKKDLLKKIDSEAFQLRKIPIFVIQFKDEEYFIINSKYINKEELDEYFDNN